MSDLLKWVVGVRASSEVVGGPPVLKAFFDLKCFLFSGVLSLGVWGVKGGVCWRLW